MKGFSYGVAEAFCPEVVLHLKNEVFDHIVITNFSSFTGILAIIYLKFKKINYYIESDGAFPRIDVFLKRWIKTIILSGALKCFSTANVHDQYYQLYGVKKEDLIRYPFTSVSNIDILDKPLTKTEKSKIRHDMEIPYEFMVISVGMFIWRKGFDILLRSCKKLDNNIGVFIIGGTPTTDYLQIVENNKLDNVHFLNHMDKEKLNKYYLAADLFVLPTRQDVWGLVINEAMAKALPIITTNNCISGLELVNELNGVLLENNDEHELASSIIVTLAKNVDFSLSIESLKKIRNYTFDEMVKVHIETFLAQKESQNA